MDVCFSTNFQKKVFQFLEYNCLVYFHYSGFDSLARAALTEYNSYELQFRIRSSHMPHHDLFKPFKETSFFGSEELKNYYRPTGVDFVTGTISSDESIYWTGSSNWTFTTGTYSTTIWADFAAYSPR